MDPIIYEGPCGQLFEERVIDNEPHYFDVDTKQEHRYCPCGRSLAKFWYLARAIQEAEASVTHERVAVWN